MTETHHSHPATCSNGQSYTVRVWAVNAVGRSEMVEAKAAPNPPEPVEGERVPGAPRDLTLTPGDGHLAVSWTVPKDRGYPALSEYLVQHRAEGVRELAGAAAVRQHPAAGGTWRTGSSTTWRVWAVNTQGQKRRERHQRRPRRSSRRTRRNEKRAPGAPRNLTLTPGDGAITANWLPPEDLGNPELTHYRAEIRANDTPASNPWVGEKVSGTTTTMVFDWALENGWPYTVRVWAVNAEGDSEMVSADGRAQGACRLSPETQPPALGSLTLTPGDGTITASWEVPEERQV